MPFVERALHDSSVLNVEAQADWPSGGVLRAAVAERVELLLGETGDRLAAIIRAVMSSEDRVLSPQPRPHSSIVVTAACVSAGGTWTSALWPAVAMECAMAAADVFDDIADGEANALAEKFGMGAVVVGAAGLLALAGGVVLRGVEDGVPERTVVDLGRILSADLVQAADGQARSLSAARSSDVVDAYELAAAKSGPLGELAARLGARTASDDPERVAAYATYGWHLAVFSQLLNDARDAAPTGSTDKRDVRTGARTVPLVYVGSTGAPPELHGESLLQWEQQERQRVAAQGGVLTAIALAQAERLHGLAILDSLAEQGRPVEGLRQLLGVT
jgi:geranylgeranyl pyrophosphate synthase